MNKPLIAIASLIYGDEFPPGVNYCNAVERAGGRPLYGRAAPSPLSITPPRKKSTPRGPCVRGRDAV